MSEAEHILEVVRDHFGPDAETVEVRLDCGCIYEVTDDGIRNKSHCVWCREGLGDAG